MSKLIQISNLNFPYEPSDLRRHLYLCGFEPMPEAAKDLFLVLSALFPIVDPLGGSPLFLALTTEHAPEARKALAWRIATNSFFLLVASYFVGTYILAFFGISLPVVQLGGGLIVISTGWTLLKQRDDERHEVRRTRSRRTHSATRSIP
jgi:small neutral amino acid transporter SnatA (MarC family)